MNPDVVKQMTECCEALRSIVENNKLEDEKNRKNELEKIFTDAAATANPESDEDKKLFDELNRTFSKMLKLYSSRIFQLYQARDLERCEHYAIKLKICDELEEIASRQPEDIFNAAQRIVQLRTRWQELGSVPHDKADELRERYHKVNEILKPHIDRYFKELDEKRSNIDNAKKEIIEQLKSIADNPNFQEATPKVKLLQDKWKELGIGHIKTDRALFKEFRAMCDSFFSARNNFFRERKALISDATSRKNALIEAAEALDPNSPDLKRNAQNLYNQWRAIPYAGKNDQNLYAKFKAAIDSAFSLIHEEEKAKMDELNRILVDFDQLAAQLNAAEITPDNAGENYKQLCRKLNSIAGGRQHSALDSQLRAAKRKIETLIQQLYTEKQLRDADSRMNSEKIIAECFAKDDCSAWSSMTENMPPETIKTLEKIAAEPPEVRRKIMADNSKQRNFIIGNWECRLGMNNSVNSNVELLALALENAIRNNFAANQKSRDDGAELETFCREFFAVPVADPADIPAMYGKFKAIAERLTKKS